MERRGLVVLLLSGSVLLCSSRTRRFHHVDLQRTWTEAQSHCREKFTDLATVEDSAEMAQARDAAESRTFWIGLFRSWRWSLESREGSAESSFRRWANGQPRAGECVLASGTALWATEVCGAMKYSVCYSADAKKHILVKTQRTWTHAQSFCRTEYTDLASISNQEDNLNVSRLLYPAAATDEDDMNSSDGTNNDKDTISAWIGLHKESWMWSDQSSASYRLWTEQEPGDSGDSEDSEDSGDSGDSEDERCGLMDTTASGWYKRPCAEKHAFMCYTVPRQTVLRSVKLRLTRRPGDLDDPRLQAAILQQLKKRLEDQGIQQDVMLRWRKQPDGKVFHREAEEQAPPSGGEEEE